MELRLATMEDFEVFNAMYVSFCNIGDSKPMTKQQYEELIQIEGIYFAVLEGEIIGYAIIYAFEDRTAKITRLYIKKRRQGYGSKFYKLLENEIRNSPVKTVYVWCFWEEAEKFWTQMGFKSVNDTEEFFKKLK